MATPKVRIYELTKVLGLSSWKELADVLESKLGVTVKSHSSTIDQDLANKVVAIITGDNKVSAPTVDETPRQKSEPAPSAQQPVKNQPRPQPEQRTAAPVSQPQRQQAPPQPTQQVHRYPEKKTQPLSGSGQRPQQQIPGGGGQQRPQPQQHSGNRPQQPASATQRPQQQGGSGANRPQQPAAQAAPKTAPVAVQANPAKPKLDDAVMEEDTAVLEIMKPAKDDEPYSEIAQTIERHNKTEMKTAFKKVAEVEKGEKPIPGTTQYKQPQQNAPVAEPEPQVIRISEPLSIAELAVKLGRRETELIRHLFMKGVMVTVNQTMQVDDAISLAKEMGFEVEGPDKEADKQPTAAPELKVRQAKGKHLRSRAPVVSIMGHVDHGKTSLLDAIRETRHKIVDTEAGGITQSIGAYTVEKDGSKIVFIDTPGHAAFTSMRMRGAQATDIAILVVAADDGVMPQTIEAINHAKAANIPIIVAVNKIDKPGADPDRVMVQLSEHGLTPEKWGGDTICVEVSALQRLGLDDLLEMISLVSELQELKADSTVPAEGVVIEARLDKRKGPVATVLVQNGTLHVGENILMNKVGGRIRALISDSGERIKSAGPSTPTEILGLSEVPQAGDTFTVVLNDKEFKRTLQQRQSQDREQRLTKMVTHGLMNERENQRKDFYLIVKADTQGSVEAVTHALAQLATEEVSVHIIHAGTGDVSEADVLLASASNAIIISFNTREEANAQRTAQDQGIEILQYDVIYHVVEDMEKRMLGLLSPDVEEQETGVVEVRQLFSFGKTVIAGCYVTEGRVTRNAQCRVFRNNKEMFKGQLSNLKRFKEDAKEVAAGYECGISFDRFNDLQVGDIIRVFTMKEIERTSL